MKVRFPGQLALCASLIMTTQVVFASTIGQATTAAGQAFAGSCAGNYGFASMPLPGDAMSNGQSFTHDPSNYYTCTTSNPGPGTVSSSASNSGNFSGNLWNNSTSASAAPTNIHLQGTNNGSPATDFSGAYSNAGWNENFTLQSSNPALVGTDLWVVPITVDGSLLTTGSGAWSVLEVGAYENYNILLFDSSPEPQLWNYFTSHNTLSNGDIGSVWDQEIVEYGDAGTHNPLNVNTTLYFPIPVTFDNTGTATFEAGFYAAMRVTETGFGNDPTLNSATVNFQNTIGWGGPGFIVDGNNQTYTDFTVTGGSGVNYEQAFAPEPATVAGSAGAGLLLVLLKVRRRKVR